MTADLETLDWFDHVAIGVKVATSPVWLPFYALGRLARRVAGWLS